MQQKKILVVEDTEDTRQMMKFLLEMSGYTVLEAVNGMQAVESTSISPKLKPSDFGVREKLTMTRQFRYLATRSTNAASRLV